MQNSTNNNIFENGFGATLRSIPFTVKYFTKISISVKSWKAHPADFKILLLFSDGYKLYEVMIKIRRS